MPMPIQMDKETVYTKTEVDRLIQEAKDEAIEEAREIDRISMARHNWTATVISMILGLIALSLFVDGLLRILGIIPPFMDLDVDIIDEIVERVESDMIPMIQDTAQKAQRYMPGR
jgi:AAA15 family ATPase/GTPase